MGPIGVEQLLEYFIFLTFLGGAPRSPPQGELTTHEFSHHEISNPPFQNPIYTHGLKYYSTENGNPIKGLLNKIHSIVTQPGKIGGGGVKKRLHIYVNGHGVVKPLWTVGQWFDIIIIVAGLLQPCRNARVHAAYIYIHAVTLQTICKFSLITNMKCNNILEIPWGPKVNFPDIFTFYQIP